MPPEPLIEEIPIDPNPAMLKDSTNELYPHPAGGFYLVKEPGYERYLPKE